MSKPPEPIHIAGTPKGEETTQKKGKEPGHAKTNLNYRNARDSTSINPDQRKPIHPAMPEMPPA